MSKDSEWEFIFSFFLFTLKVPLFESNTRVSVQLILSHTHGLQGTWGAAGGRSDSCLNEGLNEDKDHYGWLMLKEVVSEQQTKFWRQIFYWGLKT